MESPLDPSNLARGQTGRRSWAAEFALAQRCADPGTALANPHTWQRVALAVDDFPELDHLPLPKVLSEDAPTRTYRQRLEEPKSTVHWGQRKLFMAELEFLLDFAEEAKHLIYAGAAEGQHLAVLCELFPDIQLDAWDPRPFAKSALPPAAPPNLRVHQEYFTDDVARHLRSTLSEVPLLFVSDIRTANWQKDTPEEHDQRLLGDLKAQQNWVDLLRPTRALLKFRFPYTEGCTEGLAGEMRLPVWGPQTTTECRLLVTPPSKDVPLSTKFYDHKCMWEQLFYFNTVTRISIYPRPSFVGAGDEETLKTAGLCRCFDCSREVDLLATYLRRRQVATADLVRALVELARDVSLGCGRGPSGLLDAPTAPWQAQSEAPAKRPKRGTDTDVQVSQSLRPQIHWIHWMLPIMYFCESMALQFWDILGRNHLGAAASRVSRPGNGGLLPPTLRCQVRVEMFCRRMSTQEERRGPRSSAASRGEVKLKDLSGYSPSDHQIIENLIFSTCPTNLRSYVS